MSEEPTVIACCPRAKQVEKPGSLLLGFQGEEVGREVGGGERRERGGVGGLCEVRVNIPCPR